MKYGGRTKGTKNKKTVLKENAEDVLARLGCNPLQILVELTKSNDENIILGAAKELCKYVYTQKKAVEVTAEVLSTSFDHEIIEEWKKLAKLKVNETKPA